MTHTRLTSLAQSLPSAVPFVGPETQERQRGGPFHARLGANENVFGPSPKAIAAMQKASSEIWQYGDPTSYDLRTALANHHGVSIENIVVGEGIDGLLGYLVRLTVEAGDKVVTSDGAYPTFNYHVAGFGGELVKIPYVDDKENLIGLLHKAKEVDAKLVYFANPDNPMGTWMSGADIEAALDHIPLGTLLILDEAYGEFAPRDALPTIAIEDPRVIRMRTFSKAYGMAGARVGYAMGAPELITAFEKIRNHFGMNRAAQEGALAALEDQDYLRETNLKIAEGRNRLYQIAQSNGLVAIPSATNFVAIDCGQTGAFAKQVLAHLVQSGLFVRMPFVGPQDRCIRVSVGTKDDLDLFERLFPQALAAASG